jgi:hypothetical protein
MRGWGQEDWIRNKSEGYEEKRIALHRPRHNCLDNGRDGCTDNGGRGYYDRREFDRH